MVLFTLQVCTRESYTNTALEPLPVGITHISGFSFAVRAHGWISHKGNFKVHQIRVTYSVSDSTYNNYQTGLMIAASCVSDLVAARTEWRIPRFSPVQLQDQVTQLL